MMVDSTLYHFLREVLRRPAPFERYTARDLWADPHISSKMLELHLDGSVDICSRKTEFLDRSAQWITSRFELGPETSVADFGCGPGNYTTRLAGSGADVTGIDFSERSIRYARDWAERDGLTISYELADYLEFETDRRFDLITMIMLDFCVLSPVQTDKLLNKFFSFLKPGGAVLLDVLSLNAFAAREEKVEFADDPFNGFWSAAPYCGFLSAFNYVADKVTLDKHTIIEDTRTRVIYNWMQYYDRDSLGRLFGEHGFAIEEFLGDVAGAPYDSAAEQFAIVARKSA